MRRGLLHPSVKTRRIVGAHKQTERLFHELGFMSVFVLSECARVEFSRAITDGKMECVPKKETEECFLNYFLSLKEDGIMLSEGEGRSVEGQIPDTEVTRRAS